MKKIAIIGGGVEGLSNYRYFVAQKETAITILDQKPVDKKLFPLAQFVTGPHYLDNLAEYDLIVRSPGIHLNKIKAPANKITSNTREFFAHCPAPIIGVTGTKGKGTTSTLIAKFLAADGKNVHLVGNIGASALDELPKIKSVDWVVYELSSFQLIDVTQSPHIAVHLMIEPDHLDVHTDMQEYINAKANIFAYQKPNDIAVYYEANAEIAKSAQLSAATTKIAYNRNSTNLDCVRVQNGQILYKNTPVASVDSIALVGEHMLDNICAAIAATFNLVTNKGVYETVLRQFTGLDHRLQPVGTKNEVLYIDDSISTIPSTAIAAIRAFKEPKIIILGGSDKGSEYDDLAAEIANNNIKQVFLLGRMKDKIAEALNIHNYAHYKLVDTLEQAVELAANSAQKGDVVLLSPACASFDMFSGYSERGQRFAEAVKSLPN